MSIPLSFKVKKKDGRLDSYIKCLVCGIGLSKCVQLSR